jgi:hypothetical protein
MRAPLVAVAVSAWAGVASLGCGVRELPPPQAPSREVPVELDVPEDPPQPGTSRVILDANGERAKVVELTSGSLRVRPLCTTPCVLDMPYGSHPLLLQSLTDAERRSRADLEVGPYAKVLRHTLGERRDGGTANTVGTSLLVVGALAATTGALFWGSGALSRSLDGEPNGIEGTGRIVTGLGAGAMVIAIPLLLVGRPSERPGATTEWTLP